MFDPDTKILVIDDMMTMRKIVAATCRKLGFSNLTDACDGALGWEAITTAAIPFGLVISDWNMPNLTGIELLKKVRADKKFHALPFIMVTAEAEQHQIAEALKAGVSSYVIKPFSPEILRDKLETLYQRLRIS